MPESSSSGVRATGKDLWYRETKPKGSQESYAWKLTDKKLENEKENTSKKGVRTKLMKDSGSYIVSQAVI